ncbi:hypothetical protein IQ235_02100 [Oscillatoriales cyanobacterium LEGE 11467]|uniref:Methyltransferase domain-containing protein n=1 Tax=Zarconia navalis LEGE 11467 TaxID=1828826 RepID=A0A928VVP0_9CYAN|nr:class I SAM-dependent methyltransferase [Zarconia navalis]MBE9039587.1 hypothetical protein [Zarconia navalis LEGE 11467]
MQFELPEDNPIPNSTQISDREAIFHPHSIADSRIRLFRWQGQLYRGIGTERSPFFQKLFQDGAIQSLVDLELLVESELTALTLEGYETIVHHRSIPFTSYSIEWCVAMLQDATLTLLDFGIELAQRGLSLEDGHLGNILFDGYKPLFVDLGSIRPLDEYVHYFRWSAYDQFCQTCFYPLVLMALGKDRTARLLMVENSGISKSDFLRLTPGMGSSRRILKAPPITRLQLALRKLIPPDYKKLLKQNFKDFQPLSDRTEIEKKTNSIYSHNVKQKYYLKFLKNLRREVKKITLPTSFDRSKNSSPSFCSSENGTEKQSIICNILTDLKPASVLDIGCENGCYAQIAASLGSQVVAFDKDPTCVTQLYHTACDRKLSILPLVMDFTQPTPAYGLSRYRYVAATERLQCEMVLALELIHHLVFEQHPRFEQIVEGFAQFSQRWLVVEFIPIDDRALLQFQSPKYSSKFSWYTLDNFRKVLMKHFRHVKTLPAYIKPRTLLICEK